MEEANMSRETENEAVIRRWYEEVFNQGREEVIIERPFESYKLPAYRESGIIQNDKESHNVWIIPSPFK